MVREVHVQANVSEKSLQININSVDDARAVIQHLGQIKTAYEAHGCTSVEFVLAEEVVTPTAKILVGAIPWCTTFRKIVKPIGTNILFQLPHYRPLTPAHARTVLPEAKPSPLAARAAPPVPAIELPTSIPVRPKSKPSASPEPLVQAHSGSE